MYWFTVCVVRFGKELIWLRNIMWFGKVVNQVSFVTWMSVKRKSMVLRARDKSFPTLGEAERFAVARLLRLSLPQVLSLHFRSPVVQTSQRLQSLLSSKLLDMPFDIKIFTDGACEPNSRRSGTGLAVYLNNDLTELWYACTNRWGLIILLSYKV